RLSSVGKYFPYGQDRGSGNPSNGTEKFGSYKRDSETGLDYAVNRYHSSGDGRFLSPDPYDGSIDLRDPGSWNRYSYTGGDPVNSNDPNGLAWILVGGRWCSSLNPNDVCYDPGEGTEASLWGQLGIVIPESDPEPPPPDPFVDYAQQTV